MEWGCGEGERERERKKRAASEGFKYSSPSPHKEQCSFRAYRWMTSLLEPETAHARAPGVRERVQCTGYASERRHARPKGVRSETCGEMHIMYRTHNDNLQGRVRFQFLSNSSTNLTQQLLSNLSQRSQLRSFLFDL